jgi:hypothetical protein
MATFANDLRLKEITTGDEDGTWGTSTNTNLALIADAFSLGTKQMAADADETFTMPDASADGTRSLYLKITSAVSLTVTRTVTLAPNTVSKVWIIENATTGSQSITISQGSGATVTIANGSKVMIVTDGAGGGAAVTNANPTTTSGTVTSVGGTGTVNGITLTGTVTSSGNLTLGGTLSGVSLTTQVTGILPVANGGTNNAFFTVSGPASSAKTYTFPNSSATILTSASAVTVAQGGTGATTLTGVVKGNGTSAFTAGTVALGSEVSGTLPVANGGTGITSFGSGVATWLGTPSSANLAAAVTDETGSGALVFGTSPTVSGPTINDGYTEEVFSIPSSTTPALSPTNGSIQTWTLTGASTPTAGTWASGQSMTLMIDDGTANTINWATVAVTWKTDGGVAPTLNTTGFTVIALWKVSTVIYGARVGNA